jgi:hypothetical protein
MDNFFKNSCNLKLSFLTVQPTQNLDLAFRSASSHVIRRYHLQKRNNDQS